MGKTQIIRYYIYGYYILYCKDVNLIKYVFIILIFLYKRKLNYNFHENNKHFF